MARKSSAGKAPGGGRSSNVRARAAAAGGAFALVLTLVGGVAYQNRSDETTDITTDVGVDVPETVVAEETVPADTEAEVEDTLTVDTVPEEEGEVSIGLDPTTTITPTTLDTTLASTTSFGTPTTTALLADGVVPVTTLPGTESPTTVPPPTGAPTCPKADGTSARLTTFSAAPPTCIDPSATYTAKIETSKGTMTFALDTSRAPITVNNFVFLARHHFYDGLVFHRVVPKFVLQTGDPTEVGDGGPGYTIADELPPAGQYKVGSLAMASAGPNTGGSQFFVISGADGVGVDPNYALFGQLTSGLDVVRAIDAIGAPDPDPPLERVTISTITITETRA